MDKIEFLDIPSEIGAGTRGSSLGRQAVEIAAVKLGSDFFSERVFRLIEDENDYLYEPIDTPFAKRVEGIRKVYEKMAAAVSSAIQSGKFPITIAGDHATTGGMLAGAKLADPSKRIGVVWVDAHGDLHSPYTSPSGNVHGMPLATAIDDDNLDRQINDVKDKALENWEAMKALGGVRPKVQPSDIVFFGVRDTEEPEEFLMAKHGIKNYTVEEVREIRIEKAVEGCLERLSGCHGIYLSFDVDSMDCHIVSRGTGTPVPNGFTPDEVAEIMVRLVESGKLIGFDMVEVNPTLDDKGNKMAEEAFKVFEKVVNAIEKQL